MQNISSEETTEHECSVVSSVMMGGQTKLIKLTTNKVSRLGHVIGFTSIHSVEKYKQNLLKHVDHN